MTNKHYTNQFKQNAVKLMTEQGYSPSNAGETLGVWANTLWDWKKTVVPREQADLEAENARRSGEPRTSNRAWYFLENRPFRTP